MALFASCMGFSPEFTRALNAHDIMSETIPTMSESDPAEAPYCIWHPDIPSKDTLRALVKKYPNMIYHAAHVCAVTGYISLYKKLNRLPEIHVTEEAQHAAVGRNNQGSKEIWQNIMSQPVKFVIMDHYTRIVDFANPQPTAVNSNTAYTVVQAKDNAPATVFSALLGGLGSTEHGEGP